MRSERIELPVASTHDPGTNDASFAISRTSGCRQDGMVHPLFRAAVEVLDDPHASTAMKAAAGATLATAMEEELALPIVHLRAAWRWVTATAPMFYNVEVFATVDDEVVRSDAIEMFANAGSGKNERRIATTVLSGSGHARHLDDHTIMRLVESARIGAAALDLASILVEVHKARAIETAVVESVRDRWTVASVGHKEAAIVIGTQCLHRDLAWLSHMLADAEPDVQIALIYQLERHAKPDGVILDLLADRLAHERSADVRAALHRAVAAFEEVENDADRRRRRRLRLAGEEG